MFKAFDNGAHSSIQATMPQAHDPMACSHASSLLQAPVNEVVVRALKYSACIDVIDSDHKPVWALLALDVPVTNQEKKRRMCSHILKHTAAQGQAPSGPALQLSSDSVKLNQVLSTSQLHSALLARSLHACLCYIQLERLQAGFSCVGRALVVVMMASCHSRNIDRYSIPSTDCLKGQDLHCASLKWASVIIMTVSAVTSVVKPLCIPFADFHSLSLG